MPQQFIVRTKQFLRILHYFKIVILLRKVPYYYFIYIRYNTTSKKLNFLNKIILRCIDSRPKAPMRSNPIPSVMVHI